MTTMTAVLSERPRNSAAASESDSVFHKMKNVLNSVQVSTGLISQQLREFQIDDVGRVSEMLAAHEDNVAWYLTQDSKGKKIPIFLGRLSQEMRQQHLNALTELTTLQYHLEQMEYLLTVGHAPERASGLRDTVQFSAVMDEAVLAHRGELDRMEIEVVHDYHTVGQGILEVTKLRAILVTLIRNAINAMNEVPERSHRLTLRVVPCSDRDGFVRLQVEDSGCGITPDKLTQVFSPQESTIHSDHLPNLHASAVTAKELGGALRVWSDGPNKGAIFTLDLPAIHMEEIR